MLRRVAELSRALTGKEIHDVLVRDDLRPGLTELRALAVNLHAKLIAKLPGTVARRRERARAAVMIMRRGVVGQPKITFVCQGNICRSPFAAALLRAQLSKHCATVSSSGILPRPGRSTPTFGITVAAEHKVDLSQHRSSWLSREMAQSASLLITFDEITRSAMCDRYPDLCVPLILLGDLTGTGEVSDPVDGDKAEFRRCYDEIATAIQELVTLLQGKSGEQSDQEPDDVRSKKLPFRANQN
jgi:protein-tyrosine-phosphatase